MKEDYFSQLDDYDESFCEQQYTHGCCLFVRHLLSCAATDKRIQNKGEEKNENELFFSES